jgi:hypothetical protein
MWLGGKLDGLRAAAALLVTNVGIHHWLQGVLAHYLLGRGDEVAMGLPRCRQIKKEHGRCLTEPSITVAAVRKNQGRAKKQICTSEAAKSCAVAVASGSSMRPPSSMPVSFPPQHCGHI